MFIHLTNPSSGLVWCECDSFVPRFEDRTRYTVVPHWLVSRLREHTTDDALCTFTFSTNSKRSSLHSFFRSFAIQRLINQCVLNYPKILRFVILSTRSGMYGLHLHRLSHSQIVSKTIIIIIILCVHPLCAATWWPRKNDGIFNFILFLFVSCESKLPHRAIVFYGKNVIIVFFGFGCIYSRIIWTGKKVLMDIKSRICTQMEENWKKKDWNFFIFGNINKLHFNNERMHNSSVNLTSHQFFDWDDLRARVLRRWNSKEETKKRPWIKTWIMHSTHEV